MKKTLLAAALAAVGTAALAEPGYVTQSSGAGPVTTPFGLCVHSGTWSPDQAVTPCDTVPRAAAAPPPAPIAVRSPGVAHAERAAIKEADHTNCRISFLHPWVHLDIQV